MIQVATVGAPLAGSHPTKAQHVVSEERTCRCAGCSGRGSDGAVLADLGRKGSPALCCPCQVWPKVKCELQPGPRRRSGGHGSHRAIRASLPCAGLRGDEFRSSDRRCGAHIELGRIARWRSERALGTPRPHALPSRVARLGHRPWRGTGCDSFSSGARSRACSSASIARSYCSSRNNARPAVRRIEAGGLGFSRRAVSAASTASGCSGIGQHRGKGGIAPRRRSGRTRPPGGPSRSLPRARRPRTGPRRAPHALSAAPGSTRAPRPAAS